MTELEMLARAKMYMDKLAQGINPIDERAAAESDTIRNERLSRCFSYVSGVLESVIREKSKQPRVKRRAFSPEELKIRDFEFSDTPLTLSEVVKRIFATARCEDMKKFPRKALTAWLISVGLLYTSSSELGRKHHYPTESGISMGIITERRVSMRGQEYTAVLYKRAAQEFIIDNFDGVLALYEQMK